jgi:hypothetical protein
MRFERSESEIEKVTVDDLILESTILKTRLIEIESNYSVENLQNLAEQCNGDVILVLTKDKKSYAIEYIDSWRHLGQDDSAVQQYLKEIKKKITLIHLGKDISYSKLVYLEDLDGKLNHIFVTPNSLWEVKLGNSLEYFMRNCRPEHNAGFVIKNEIELETLLEWCENKFKTSGRYIETVQLLIGQYTELINALEEIEDPKSAIENLSFGLKLELISYYKKVDEPVVVNVLSNILGDKSSFMSWRKDISGKEMKVINQIMRQIPKSEVLTILKNMIEPIQEGIVLATQDTVDFLRITENVNRLGLLAPDLFDYFSKKLTGQNSQFINEIELEYRRYLLQQIFKDKLAQSLNDGGVSFLRAVSAEHLENIIWKIK